MTRRLGPRTAGLLVAFAVMVTACAQSPGARSLDSPTLVLPGTGGESTAIELVNLWRVSDVPGEPVDTWLRLDMPGFQLWRDCGMIQGSWRATEKLFLASIHGASGGCVTGSTLPSVPWLDSVSGYRAVGDGMELSDSSGAVVATLSVDGAPDAIATAAEFYTEPPVVTDAMRQALRSRGSLRGEYPPATPQNLVGRWVSVTAQAADSHVIFMADGTWSGSDGCNGAQGRWAADGTGALLATSGPSTMVGCVGGNDPTWVSQAHFAIIDDELLRLLDIAGSELGALRRDY